MMRGFFGRTGGVIGTGMAIGVGASLLGVSPAHAWKLTPGATYFLHDFPGSANPPLYGFRWDELADVTPGEEDIFTMSFDAPGADMRMEYDVLNGRIRVFGTAFGGRDVGTTWANDQWLGFYTFDMTYNVGVTDGYLGDDDTTVQTDNPVTSPNTGFFSVPASAGGFTINIWDKVAPGTGATFHVGDWFGNTGYADVPGISGWGWVNDSPTSPFSPIRDWQFRVGEVVPAPGAVALLGLGGVIAGRRRR